MQTKLEQAYIECLELAKANALKVVIWIENYYTKHGDSFIVTVKNKFAEGFRVDQTIYFNSFVSDEEIDSELEKVKNLIKESL